jgi:hypothetical protein
MGKGLWACAAEKQSGPVTGLSIETKAAVSLLSHYETTETSHETRAGVFQESSVQLLFARTVAAFGDCGKLRTIKSPIS